MRILFSLLSFLLFTALLQHVVAQDRSISGRVTDVANGQGLPGVTVLVKGTTVGASTNSDGSYTISGVPATASALTFSFIGYRTVERPIGNATTVDVGLSVDTRQLDEVVVTGLATTVKRSNLANAVTTISAKELVGSTRPVTVDAALNGKIVGANIAQTSGAPGGGVAIQLRGISSLTGGTQPLYIIDGVYAVNAEVGNGAGAAAFSAAASTTTGRSTQDNPVNRLSDLNPNDIESIEVLKGSSAAAIYGQRANAGVIIIKTKRGQAGQTRVSLSQDIGFAKAWRLLGKEDWTPEKIDRYYPLPAPLGPDATPAQVTAYNKALEAANASRTSEKEALKQAQDNGQIHDYEKEVFGNTGFIRNTSVSVSGGSDKTKFYVSGTTTDEKGIVKRTGFERHSIRANVDHKIGKRIDIGLSSGYFNSTNRRGFTGNDNRGVSLGYTLAYVPSYAQLFPNEQGIFPSNPYGGDNPLAIVERSINEETTNRAVQAASTTVRIIENERSSLRLALQGGIDYSNSNAFLALPADLQSQRNLPVPADRGAVRVAKNQFFNSNLQGFLVYDWRVGERLNLTSQVGMVRLRLERNLSFSQGRGLAPGEPLTPNRSSNVSQEVEFLTEQDLGLVAQQEANFNDQIIATAGIRFDKSSRNGDPNKYYAFPKASLAVNVAKFGFWALEPMNLLKLRAAYGETGAPAFFGATYSPLVNITTGSQAGFLPSTVVGNPAIGPERATELEFGVDAGFLDNRIGLEATYYNKTAKDLINTFVLAPSTGVTSVRAFPVGDLRNRGIELALNATPVRSENFTWTSSTQYWFNRSEVTRIVVPSFNTGLGFGNSFGRNVFALGQSPSRWYGSPVNAVDNASNPSFLTRYEDAQPRFQMSFQNSFTFLRNFEASFLLHWRKDSYTSNLSRLLQDEGGTTEDWSRDDDGNGVVNGLQRQSQPAREFIQNSGYLRLREASLYYSVPASIRTSLFKDYIRSIRVGVSGNNLLTWTDYVGYDPEVSNFGSTSNFAQVDVSSYPNTRRMFFHLNLEF
ncbi:SusC/RagA family TonB-linked outer membrane protein [Hymenobacter lutimineralis]|uniref:SusC/RagA family TonB-linked outer membrane protein n=1 Tax=Hymenobacter lutimineralis TaxID=2606448 RepID=A0A5D6UYZ2_9BACT|nr:SusC/RagA family TonB-linked outer membrane protein [Hymenobacter lutimineralis]TYZ08636.1 SusC/RagA family TonB-linked outer membrane protein [Hymenobacter lutimineralis]